MSLNSNPFEALGLPERPDLTDEDVRAAWRRVAAATHPDRPDGGDLARYTAASAAYAELRTPWGRSEAYADLAERTDGPVTSPIPPIPGDDEPLPRRGQRLVVAGDRGDRRGDRPVGPFGEVGVGLGAAPGGAQFGVGSRGGGVPGQVAAVGPVRVGGGGDPPPGGADVLVGQVGAFGQAERLKRVRVQAHRGSPGSKKSSRPPGDGH